MSYQELNWQVNKLASYFIAQGIVKGNVIGIAADRSVELLITLLAVFKAGAAYLPWIRNTPTNAWNTCSMMLKPHYW